MTQAQNNRAPHGDDLHIGDFDAMYRAGDAPWDIGRPQPALLELATAGKFTGRVLDVGCGTGEHVLLAASLGLPATGIDLSPTAITSAQRKANERGLSARFILGDAMELSGLSEQFDTIIDCGLFHVFSDAERKRYIDGLRTVTRTGSHLFMMCFSDLQPGDWGPRRISESELRAAFADGWSVNSLQRSAFDTSLDGHEKAQAWLAALQRSAA